MGDRRIEELRRLLAGPGGQDPALFVELIPLLPAPLLSPAAQRARQIADPSFRALALMTIAGRMPEAEREILFEEALAAARPVLVFARQSPILVGPVAGLVGQIEALAPVLPQELLPRAVEIAVHVVAPSTRTTLLPALASGFPPPNRDILLEQAFNVARVAPAWKSNALVGIAPYLSESRLGEVLAAAEAMDEPWEKVPALAGLAQYLSPAQVQEALRHARAIQDPVWRAQALAGLAPHLPPAEQAATIEEALHDSLTVSDSQPLGEALQKVAPLLSGELLEAALRTVVGIPEEATRAEALSRLVPYLPPRLLSDALQAARRLLEGERRARTLAELARRLPEAEWLPVLEEALQAAIRAEPAWSRASVLTGVLAPLLPPVLLPKALATARTIGGAETQAGILVDLAPYMPEGERAALYAEALQAARSIDDSANRAEALIRLLPHLEDAGRPVAGAEALVAIQQIQDPWQRVQVFRQFAPHVTDPLHEPLLQIVQATSDERQRTQILLAVATAPGAPRETLVAALATASRLPDAQERAWELSALAPFLPLELLREAVRSAHSITDDGARARAVADLVPYLPEADQPEALDEALATALAAADEQTRAWVLAKLAPRLAEPSLRIALAAARALATESARAQAVSALAAALALLSLEAERLPLLQEALETALLVPLATGLGGGGEAEEVTRQRILNLLLELPESGRLAVLQEAVLREAAFTKSLESVVEEHATVGARPVVRPTQERLVNTGFASGEAPDSPLDPATPLECERSFYFWLEIGPAIKGSIEQTPAALPVEHLPSEARLSVALFAFGGWGAVISGGDVGEIQLQADGTARVTRQPSEPAPGSVALDRRLFFPVRTPAQQGVLLLRCNIYYEQMLVQSRLIRARVVAATPLLPRAIRAVLSIASIRGREEARESVLRSDVDYTLTRTLDPVRLQQFGVHRLSVLLGAAGENELSFCLFGQIGEELFKRVVPADAPQLQSLIQQARGALRQAAWGSEGDWHAGDVYRYEGPPDLKRLRDDLIRLAIRGYRIYDVVVGRGGLAGGREAAQVLAEMMLTPGVVQVATGVSPRHHLPAAVLYDYPLDTNAAPEGYTLCPGFLEAFESAASLDETPCFQGICPSRGNNIVVCPSGFWGFRHALGMPPPAPATLEVPTEIAYAEGPAVAVAVSTDPAFVLRQAHEAALQALRAGLDWRYADRRASTLTLLRDARPHLVYLYCHGGVQDGIPFLQVGAPGERGITRDNLRAANILWDEPRPLVFINGCRTTALEPEQAMEFVSAFLESAAAGVIGTEITVFEPLASAFAEECLRRFLGEAPLGEAVRGARLALLKAGNPLGLAYVPFAVASLRLVGATSLAPTSSRTQTSN